MLHRTGVGALIFTLLVAVPAWAQGCPPLTLYTSIGLTAAGETLAEFVPVTIEGVPKLMLLDTGGVFSMITKDAADELKLPRRRAGFDLLNSAGESTNELAWAGFSLGALKADKLYFVIAPEKQKFSDDARVAGLLAPDVLKNYDVELDFAKNKMSLLSQDHCPGKVIFWPAATVAVVPMSVLDSGHITVPATLDGRSIIALVDTGAYSTTLMLPAAVSEYGLKLGSPDTPKTGELLAGSPSYRHTFTTLGFEGVMVNNPAIDIIPDMNHNKMSDASVPETGSHLNRRSSADTRPSLIIGMDVLRHFHLYIAYKENKLYITPASPPSAVGPAAPLPAAH